MGFFQVLFLKSSHGPGTLSKLHIPATIVSSKGSWGPTKHQVIEYPVPAFPSSLCSQSLLGDGVSVGSASKTKYNSRLFCEDLSNHLGTFAPFVPPLSSPPHPGQGIRHRCFCSLPTRHQHTGFRVRKRGEARGNASDKRGRRAVFCRTGTTEKRLRER